MENSLSLNNKNILVTGVSRVSGIGAAIARMCAQSGANVIVHGNPQYDISMGYSDASVSFCCDLEKNYNVRVLASTDLSANGEPEKVIKSAQNLFGNLDGIVLNHAYSVNSTIFDCTAENIDSHFNINVRASMLMIQSFAKQIDKSKGGVVTLFTSGQYLGPMTNEIAYAVSKEAIRGLCVQASAALASHNIRVNCINPGPTDTNYLTGSAYDEITKMFPSGRWGTPDDAARLVHFLHSDYAKWITGQTIASEGGFQR
ncbi:MAG TPA: SDR family oxidoreductase [Oculatellaceae cyanobacterium]|jgi:3-oxoacyl-[acyl-carrier protein] reductase